MVQTLEQVCRQVGYPTSIRVDNGSEFVSRDLDLWAYHKGVVLDFSRPGKPTDNSYIESFNGKFRTECLNAHWFMSLDDARAKMEDWRRDLYETVFVNPSSISPKIAFLQLFAVVWRSGTLGASTCMRLEPMLPTIIPIHGGQASA